MPWIEANTGASGNYEDGVAYEMTIKSIEFKPGEAFGDQFKIIADLGEREEWIFVSLKLGKHQGRVAKLRGLANACFLLPENAEIAAVNSDTFELRYPDGTVRQLKPGMTFRAKGEWLEGKDGQPKWYWQRFAAVVDEKPAAKKKAPTPAVAAVGAAIGTAADDEPEVKDSDIPW